MQDVKCTSERNMWMLIFLVEGYAIFCLLVLSYNILLKTLQNYYLKAKVWKSEILKILILYFTKFKDILKILYFKIGQNS